MNLTDDMKRLGWLRCGDHFDKDFATEGLARQGRAQAESTFAAHGRRLREVKVYRRPGAPTLGRMVKAWCVEAYWEASDMEERMREAKAHQAAEASVALDGQTRVVPDDWEPRQPGAVQQQTFDIYVRILPNRYWQRVVSGLSESFSKYEAKVYRRRYAFVARVRSGQKPILATEA